MKPDLKELAYKIYEEFINQSLDYLPEPVKAETPFVIGGVYLTIINKKPVHYLLLRQISDEYYECLKLSSFYELSDYNDVYYRLNIEDQMYIIQTALNFYLHSDEIKSAIYLENLSEDFLDELKKFINLTDEQKIDYVGKLQKGFYYPIGNRWVSKFKEQELNIIKEYHLRIFQIMYKEETKQIVELPKHIQELIDKEYRIKE
jgi:hypothetical protein